MKALKPIKITDTWHRPLQARIAAAFADIFAPLIRVLDDDEKENAKETAVIAAIRRGEVRYRGGAFQGKFSAAVSKEIKELGGVFKNGAWVIPADRLSPSLLIAATRAETRLRRLQDEVRAKAAEIVETIPDQLKRLDLTAQAQKVEGRVEASFRETVTREIGVSPKLSESAARQIRGTYSENVKLSISGFAKDDTEALRKGLQDLITEGKPRSVVREFIEARLRVSQERAKFIARQETALFTSKLKETQYKGAGINEYRWSTVGDARVRQRHKSLNGKRFRWDAPPIVDEATGKRGHPGEDYNCRCVAVPLVDKI